MTLASIGRRTIDAAAVGFACLLYSYLTLPDVRGLATSNPSTTAFIELRAREAREHGTTLRRDQRWVSYARISPSLKRAVLVAEDASFWRHEGVDYDELQKSIEIGWVKRRFRGASTLTQQLAKNLYLSPTRSPIRKLRFSPCVILAPFFEWGDGVYGVEAASRRYFGLPASDLEPSESALLAAAIVNPRELHPSRPTARLVARQQIILRKMGA